LHEELWGDSESAGATDHPKIMRLSRAPIDPAWLSVQLVELEQLADDGDTLEVVAKLGAIVREPKREQVLRDSVTKPADPPATVVGPWTPSGSLPD
jgi:FlaA1/EpsC-like NDP-sugar epimerase